RQGVPHGVDPVRLPRRARRQGAEARGDAQGDGLQGGAAVRRRLEWLPRRPQRLLPAAVQAVRLQPARRSEGAAAQRGRRLLAVHRLCPRGRARRATGVSRARKGRRLMLKAPGWEMSIVWYFFLGGIAGGAYFTAAIADNFGSRRDRPVVKIGYLLS